MGRYFTIHSSARKKKIVIISNLNNVPNNERKRTHNLAQITLATDLNYGPCGSFRNRKWVLKYTQYRLREIATSLCWHNFRNVLLIFQRKNKENQSVHYFQCISSCQLSVSAASFILIWSLEPVQNQLSVWHLFRWPPIEGSLNLFIYLWSSCWSLNITKFWSFAYIFSAEARLFKSKQSSSTLSSTPAKSIPIVTLHRLNKQSTLKLLPQSLKLEAKKQIYTRSRKSASCCFLSRNPLQKFA